MTARKLHRRPFACVESPLPGAVRRLHQRRQDTPPADQSGTTPARPNHDATEPAPGAPDAAPRL